MLSLVAGTTSKSIGIFIGNSSVTTGAGLTGLAFDTASLVCNYFQPRITADVPVTLATLATPTTAYSSGGFVEIDATNMPGWYRLDIPNAALTGATSVLIGLQGAANMRPVQVEIELTAWNNQDAVRGGMTALPNADAAASGGLIINGSNSGTVTLAALTITGAALLSSTLTVTGATTFTGAVSLSSTLGITGAFTTTNASNDIRGVVTTTANTSAIAVAVRDVNNASPAALSLGAAVNEAANASYGAFAITVTVVDTLAAALQNALVQVDDGITAISQMTNVSGNASFSLNAATYTVSVVKAGYSFTPTTRTVTGNQAGTLVNNLVMTQVVPIPAPPANPLMGIIYGSIINTDGSGAAGVQITASLQNPQGSSPAYKVGSMLIPNAVSAVTIANGTWTMDLFGNADITPSGSYWQVMIGETGFSANVTVVSGASQDMNALIS